MPGCRCQTCARRHLGVVCRLLSLEVVVRDVIVPADARNAAGGGFSVEGIEAFLLGFDEFP